MKFLRALEFIFFFVCISIPGIDAEIKYMSFPAFFSPRCGNRTYSMLVPVKKYIICVCLFLLFNCFWFLGRHMQTATFQLSADRSHTDSDREPVFSSCFHCNALVASIEHPREPRDTSQEPGAPTNMQQQPLQGGKSQGRL